jgi:hypothetical protein
MITEVALALRGPRVIRMLLAVVLTCPIAMYYSRRGMGMPQDPHPNGHAAGSATLRREARWQSTTGSSPDHGRRSLHAGDRGGEHAPLLSSDCHLRRLPG